MSDTFKVTEGKGCYRIVDDYGTVFGWYLDKDDADYYCEMLNEKFASIKAVQP